MTSETITSDIDWKNKVDLAVSGSLGSPGSSGVSGISGVSGSSGVSGVSGSSGSSGVSGVSGSRGIGVSGSLGLSLGNHHLTSPVRFTPHISHIFVRNETRDRK